jgi:hypothetical protein
MPADHRIGGSMTDWRCRWAALFCGDELDRFLLTPVGYLTPELHVSAVEGGYGGYLAVDDFALALRLGDRTGLFAVAPQPEAFGTTITAEDSILLMAFYSRNRVALHRHWRGQMSSFSMLARLR